MKSIVLSGSSSFAEEYIKLIDNLKEKFIILDYPK